MANRRNEFLDAGLSDESGHEEGYDSEAAEKGRTSTGRPSKRRKLSPADDDEFYPVEDKRTPAPVQEADAADQSDEESAAAEARHGENEEDITTSQGACTALRPRSRRPLDTDKKKKTPGVVYLSSLPPYLKPSALRNLLSQRGFSPITRLFLTPASKAKSTSKKNSRQLYTEGWIEFASKKTARGCAESLNANPVGGKKGGFYHDDVWNMKYLKGMAWADLMAGVREERREEEGRRDEERRAIARETKGFLQGVEEGKRMDGMKRKRAGKGTTADASAAGDEVKRTWRQFETKGGVKEGVVKTQTQTQPMVDDTTRRVLAKIF